jgi:hypothetical protein
MSERDVPNEQEAHEPPRGALLLTLIYLVVIAVLWASVYLQLLQRGVAQP